MDVLRGLKVLDLTVWAFCPAAGAVLASWGADVIHIENPHAPDPMRLFQGGTTEPGGASWMFQHYNRGKRGLALNLADERARDILYRLVEEADVFLTSYLPATRRKLGVDVEDIRARNPRIVYAKGTGAGPRGPESERGGYDGASWWARGSLAATAMAVTGTDFPPGMVGHGDGMSGLAFAGGICAALLQRERTDVAPVVDSSLLSTALWFNGPAVISSLFPVEDQLFQSKPPREATPWTNGMYETADHRFVHLSFLGDPQKDWLSFCAALGKPDLAADERFATAADRARNNIELIGLLDPIFAGRTLAEWRTSLAGITGVWAPVQTPKEMHEDPQAIANGFVQEVSNPGGTLSLVTPPVLFDQDPGKIRRAPEFGEHTEDILTGLGIPAADIDELRRAGVVA
ncbi:MAG TPA: CoA transferase [Amycolatopsis sp.]|nr:CoA transferase [Amycolatopsis sp.]